MHRQLERANAGCGRTHHAIMRICMCICMWYAATARVRSSVERRSSAREREEAEATRELGEATRQPTWRSRRRHMTCVRAPGSFSLPGVPFGFFCCAGHAPRAWQRRAALHAAPLAALVLPLRVRVQPGLWVVMELRHLHNCSTARGREWEALFKFT